MLTSLEQRIVNAGYHFEEETVIEGIWKKVKIYAKYCSGYRTCKIYLSSDGNRILTSNHVSDEELKQLKGE